MDYEKQTEKLERKEKILQARTKVLGQKIDMANRKRNLRNIQMKSYEEMIDLPLPFINRGINHLHEFFLGSPIRQEAKMEEYKEVAQELPNAEEQETEQVEEPRIEQPSIFDDLSSHLNIWISESL